MKLILIIILLVAALCLFGAWRYNRQLKEKAKKCSVGAKQFHEKLQQLSDPSHLLQFGPLLDTVNDLYDSRFISNEYLDRLGLGEFMEERKLLNHIQLVNNQQHKS